MRTFVLLLNVFCFAFSFAQQSVSGVVIGEKSNQPQEFVNVLIVKTDKEILTGTVTDANGKFSVQIPEGNYQIRMERFGETLWSKDLSITQNINLGKVFVKEANELSDVTVVAQRPTIEAKAGGIVFNLENTMVGKGGGTVINALKTTPGIIIQQNKIKIMGKAGAKIYINDRPVQMSAEEVVAYLDGLPADAVKSVEVLTMPPAKYQVEGNSGVVNITLKKAPENAWKNKLSATYYQWEYPFFNFRNYFTYSKDKVDVTFSLFKNAGNIKNTFNSEIFYPVEKWEDNTQEKEFPNRWTARLGVDYRLSPKATVGAVYSGNFKNNNTDFQNYTSIFQNNTLFEDFKTFGNERDKNHFNSFDVYYDQKLDTLGRKLSLMLDYFHSQNQKERLFNSTESRTKTNNGSDTRVKNYNAQIDVEHPFKFKKIAFQYGAKLSHTQTRSGVTFFDVTTGTPVADPTKTSDFAYTENLQALYAEAQKSFSEKVQAKVGLRVENVQTKAEQLTYNQTNKRNYTQFLPSASLQYVPNQMQMYSLSYSRQVKRPEFWRLDPFRYYMNEYAYQQGNPFLQSVTFDNFEFQFVYAGTFISKLMYIDYKDGFSQYVKIDPLTKQRVITVDNYLDKKQFIFQQTLVLAPASWWELQLSGLVGYIQAHLSKNVAQMQSQSSYWVGQGVFNNYFYLNKAETLTLAVDFQATSSLKELGLEVKPTQKLDIELGASFLDKKLQIDAFVNDVFGTDNFRSIATVNGVAMHLYQREFTQYAGLRLSYTFGNKKINVKEKSQANEQEKDRTKGQ